MRASLRTLLLAGLLTLIPSTAQAAAPAGLHPVLATLPGSGGTYLLGGWQDGRWLTDAQTRSRMTAGAAYTRLPLGGSSARVQGSRPASLGEPCEATFEVKVTPAREGMAVLTSARLNAQPRPVTVLPTRNATYEAAVRDELKRRGLPNPQVNLTRLIRADLDGNGTQEVIIEARRFQNGRDDSPPPVGQPGDYSLLLLRAVVNGKVVTTVLGEHIAPQTPWDSGSSEPMPMATLHRLAGVADLNGDGRMELVLYGAYYEGSGFSVQQWTPAGLKGTPLESGCGV
ncbi:hypothetical protein [Deinococcus actinosclerus]|uniref:VCBS repeat-containing protein n=1 Tax=Deinococcus actinosclerus TaxID=1768108 RepID=A0ABN4K223_9DEIO|nr:hypothetical protein [Deinococcus actinosclerus]ALW88164.1 hypothetical protein AUC44_04025 [Deinococcus actinosclerus]